jgi:hypothetical protein
MAYLGKAPINGFHAKQTLTGDGSTTSFALDQTVATETSIIVSVGGVIQEPKTAYNLTIGGTKIDFTAAPVSTDRVYVQFLGTAIVQNVNDINGSEFVLDLDGDTSFTADTDDEVDIRVGGADKSTIKSTGFHNIDSFKYVAGTGDDLQLYHDGSNSYLANSTGALKIATETSGIAITLGHTTSEITVADNMTVAGDLTVTGTASFGDTNITNVGSITLDSILDDGGTITLDSSGDIVLDAAGNDFLFKAGGTTIATHTNSSSDYVIQTAVSDKDFIIKGNDGGSTITPFTIDMSAGGDLFLTGGLIDLKNDGSAVSQIKFYCESSNAHAQTLIGAPHSESATNTLTLPDGSNGVLLSTVSTATVTNKTLTSPVINTGTFGTSILPTSADGTTLGSASKEFSDLFLADASTIQFGNDQDVTLTHVADTGLLLSSTDKLMFNDASQFIHAPSATVLDIAATDEIELTSTLVDVVGNLTVSGTIVSTGTITGTLATAAQGNVTSLGTLTALTVDDVAVDGKVITMTGSSGDTFITTVAANGATSLVTTDAAAAAANLTITADGTVGINSTGDMTLDSSGDIILDAAGDTIFLKDAGTTFGSLDNTSANLIIKSGTTTALTFSGANVTAAGTIGSGAITSTGIITGTGFTAGSAVLAEAELELLDGITAGTTAASKVFTADSNNLTAISGAVVLTEDTLSFDSTQDWDVRASPVAKVTLTANVTFDAPSNPTTGQYISILCIQDAGGTNTIAWNAVFEFTGDEAPTATTTGARGDLFTFRYNGAKWLEVGRNLNLVLS